MKQQILHAQRDSNLELYRIVCMLLIISHHFVVNSGLMEGPISGNPGSPNSIFLLILGMWGKTGINCFLMITGYYLCVRTISIRKFIKLILEALFYICLLYSVFLIMGKEQLSILRLGIVLFPFWDISHNFVVCFLLFYLTIPFWNILITNMNLRQHQMLLLLLLTIFSVIGNIPYVDVSLNYVVWFGVIYLLASYVRLYPSGLFFENRRLWGIVLAAAVIVSIASVLVMNLVFGRRQYFFVSDANKLLAVVIAFSSFLWIKNISIPYSKLINAIASTTFGILLIHANSDTMRSWLWRDVIDCVGHYSLPLPSLALYCFICVLTVFCICSIIDYFRIRFLERPLFLFLDSKYNTRKYWIG